MNLKNINNNNVLFSLFLYLSLIIGFIIDENLNHGSYYDWAKANILIIEEFSSNFVETFLNYEKLGMRHSPIYLIFLSSFLNLGLDFDQIRFLHMHLSIPLIIIFYKCLKLKFDKINSNTLQLLSLIIFLSPTFRSLSIWPDSRLPGLLFFILSIYFFLKFEKENNLKYAWFNCISLIISSYISPNFSLFFLYFFFSFIKKIEIKKIIPLLFFNFLASIPAIYYIFILKINFLISGKTPGLNETFALSFNFADKILIISTIILFHLIPIIVTNSFYKKIFDYFKKNIFTILILFTILIYFFNYQASYTGGGVFFQISLLFFENNYLFYIVSFFSLCFIFYLSSLSLNNFLLMAILIMTNIQNTIYHKYYEPLVIILFFTLLENVSSEDFLKKKTNLILIYFFSLIYILLRLYKSYYLS